MDEVYDAGYEFDERRAEFFRGEDFKQFFLPLVAARRADHIEEYISKGGEDPRVRIRELEDLLTDVEMCLNLGE